MSGKRSASRRRGKRTVTRQEYRAYIQSPAWRAQRRRYFESKLPKTCQGCGAGGVVDLHHRTYKNLGAERLMDLIPLCRACHIYVHEQIAKSGHNLWGGTKQALKRLKATPRN